MNAKYWKWLWAGMILAVVISVVALYSGGVAYQAMGVSHYTSDIEMSSADIHVEGNELYLDVDDDTSIAADTDDQVDVEIAGADEWVFTADQLDATNGQIVNIGAAGTDFDSNGGLTLAGGFVLASTTITVTDGQTITPTVYSGYRLNAAGAVTITLAVCSNDFQALYLYGEDNQDVTVADTNVRTNDGGVQVIGQYDLIGWMCVNAEWVELSDSNNS